MRCLEPLIDWEHSAAPPPGPASQVRRLEPLIDWEHEARTQLGELRAELDSSQASLALASSERTGLLRENDKIIAHYR